MMAERIDAAMRDYWFHPRVSWSEWPSCAGYIAARLSSAVAAPKGSLAEVRAPSTPNPEPHMTENAKSERVKLWLVDTTPEFRHGYRLFRRLGFSRHDVNMMMVGAAVASGHARIEVGPPPREGQT